MKIQLSSFGYRINVYIYIQYIYKYRADATITQHGYKKRVEIFHLNEHRLGENLPFWFKLQKR